MKQPRELSRDWYAEQAAKMTDEEFEAKRNELVPVKCECGLDMGQRILFDATLFYSSTCSSCIEFYKGFSLECYD